MPFEIQARLREEKSVIKELPSNWRVEFMDMDLKPERAVHISVQFTGHNIDRDYGEKLVDAILKAINGVNT